VDFTAYGGVTMFEKALMAAIRHLFCHVDSCAHQGPGIFF
jgi:hypothetical protein